MPAFLNTAFLNRASLVAVLAQGLAAIAGSADAAQPPVTVNCAQRGQTITGALDTHPAANGGLTLLVNGTCTESVVINRFSGVTIQGNPTATLKPVHPTDTPVTANTRLILDNVSIAGGSATGLVVQPRSFVTLQNSKITGTGTGAFVYDNSSIDLIDSTISAIGAYGIQSGIGGTINVHANAGETTEITGAQVGIFCNEGTLALTTTGTGKILVDKNKRLGLQPWGCGVQTFNPGGAIIITANGTAGVSGAGIEQRGGTAILNDVQITNNVGFWAVAAELNAGVQLNHVTLTGNGAGVSAAQGAVVQFVNSDGASTVKNNGAHVFGCYQGGQIYVNQITSTITPTPTSAQLGCLHVGGP